MRNSTNSSITVNNVALVYTLIQTWAKIRQPNYKQAFKMTRLPIDGFKSLESAISQTMLNFHKGPEKHFGIFLLLYSSDTELLQDDKPECVAIM